LGFPTFLLFLHSSSVFAQVFVTGLGGAAALSNAATATPSPPSASNYDSKVGPALNATIGYHASDWVSFQAGYIWNRNRIVTTNVAGATFSHTESTRGQYAVSGDLLLYFRPRTSRIRPYLSAGPAWVRLSKENKLGLRVAVGADLMIGSGWGLRYSFSEMISANPFATALYPPAQSKLMNFQNLFGFVKVF
jgi:outer membrane protein W